MAQKNKNNGKVTVALIQMKMSSSQEKNFSKATDFIRKAAGMGAQIIALSELFLDFYFPQKEGMEAHERAHIIPGLLTEKLCALARELRVVLVCGSVYEKEKELFYNTSFVIDSDGRVVGKYRKMHIPHDSGFYEKDYFKEGNLGFPVFETKYGKIGVLICYDQWYPEAARILALQGANIIFYPTAIGFVEDIEPVEGDWVDAWQTVQRGHGIASGVHIAAINRVGKEGETTFFGSSFVSGPFGTFLGKASQDKEEILLVSCDFGMNKDVKEGWMFFQNRRPKEYDLLVAPQKDKK